MKIKETPTFKRDLKKLIKKHYDMHHLSNAVNAILNNDQRQLKSFKSHTLKGNWSGYFELHISGDWLLIYKIDNEELILTLTRTGSHDQLF